jgi:hypothetical protein
MWVLEGWKMYKFFLDYDRNNLDGIVVPEDFIFTKEQVIKAFENIDPCYGSSDDWTHYEDELEMNFLLEVGQIIQQDCFKCEVVKRVLRTPDGCGDECNELIVTYVWNPIFDIQLERSLEKYFKCLSY